MIGNRAQALAYIDEDEGPEVNVSPGEPGGISCHGVSLTVLQEYHAAHGMRTATADDVRHMTTELAGQVYSWRFLDPIRFDDLPAGIDYRLADCAITLGLTGACVATQMALAMWPVTGKMDDATIGALHAEDPRLVIAAIDAAWITWKHGQGAEGWKSHGHGWTNRVRRVRDRALRMTETAK
jgi:lysozyme family protein